jgi:hypothetical protein
MPKHLIRLEGEPLFDMPHAAYQRTARIQIYAEWISPYDRLRAVCRDGIGRPGTAIRHSSIPDNAFQKPSGPAPGRRRDVHRRLYSQRASLNARWACVSTRVSHETESTSGNTNLCPAKTTECLHLAQERLGYERPVPTPA